jgi:hypothetical protein
MEDPRLVQRAVAGFAVATGVGSLAVSLYSWDVSPLAMWALMMVGAGATFLVITGIFAVTIWPFVLLIAKVFDRREVRKPSGSTLPEGEGGKREAVPPSQAE